MIGGVAIQVGIEFEHVILVVIIDAPGLGWVGVDPIVKRPASEFGLPIRIVSVALRRCRMDEGAVRHCRTGYVGKPAIAKNEILRERREYWQLNRIEAVHNLLQFARCGLAPEVVL